MIDGTAKFVSKVKSHTVNIFWSNVNQAVMALAALLISVVFARFADKELYGQFLFVLATFGLFLIISIPGTRIVILRTIAQGYDGVYRKATKFSFLWSMLGIPLAVMAGIIVYLFKAKIVGLSLIACALFFPLVTTLQNWMFILKGRSEFKKLTIYNSIKFVTNLIVVTLSVILTKNLIFILLGYFLVHSFFNILYHLKSLTLLRNDDIDPGWKGQSYALTIMDISSIAFGQVDIIFIGMLLSDERLAVYGLVMKFVDVFLKAIKCTVEGILPTLFRSKITIRYFYRFFAASFLLPIVLYPFVKYPIILLYSQKYAEVISFSQVYLAVIPFYFVNTITNCFMVKYQLNKEINLCRIISIIAVVTLYAVLIPLYGIWGGVIASILYYVIQLIINLLLLKLRKSRYSQASVNGTDIRETSSLSNTI